MTSPGPDDPATGRPAPAVVLPYPAAPGAPLERGHLLATIEAGGPQPASLHRLVAGRLEPVWQGPLAALPPQPATPVAEPLLLRIAVDPRSHAPGPAAPPGPLAACPLDGCRVVVTRTLADSLPTALALATQGAETVILPCLELAPPADPALLEGQLAQAATRYDDLLVTSPHGALALAAAADALGRRLPDLLGPLRIAAVGPRTAQTLRALGLTVGLVADEASGEGLATCLLEGGGGPRRALLPRAAVGGEALPRRLRRAGWEVVEVAAYETRTPAAGSLEPVATWLEEVGADVLLFASPSAVRGLRTLLGPARAERLAQGAQRGAIGPVTAAALRDLGWEPQLLPRCYTIEALLAELIESRQLSAGGLPRPPAGA